MHSIGLFPVLLASLALNVHGDLIMNTQTYDINATATDSKGKTIPVKGQLVNFQVIYLSTKDNQWSDDVIFNISASVPKRESNNVNLESSDYVDSVPTAEFDDQQKIPRMGPFPPYSPQFPIPLPTPRIPPAAQSHSSSSSSESGSKPQSLPELLPGPLNRTPPKPLPPHVPSVSHQSNSSSSSSNTTAHPSHQPLTQENLTAHGASGKGKSRAKRSVESMDYLPTAKPSNETPKTYKVQNITIVPNNHATSVNLSPVAGYPWIRNTNGGDNSTQVYQNAHYLNLRAPITNASVSSSPYSLSDNGEDDLSVSKDSTGGEQYYNNLQNLLLSAKQNATDNVRSVIEGYFNDSGDKSNVVLIDDIMNKTLDEILSQEEDIMDSNDESGGEEMEDRFEYGGGSPENTSEAHGGTPTKTASTEIESNGSGNQTTGGTNSGTTTENPSTVGSGNVLISSWMVILSSMIAVILSIV